MSLVKNPHQDLYAVCRETRTALAFAKARVLDTLLHDLEHLAGQWAQEPEPEPAAEPAPTLDADEARAVVASPEPAPEPTAPRKVTRRAKVDAEPEAEPTPTPSRIRAPKAAQAQVALPVQDAAPVVAEADGDGPF